MSAWRNGKRIGERRKRLGRLHYPPSLAGSSPAALTKLPKAQCSSGTTQSRPYPTRAVKVMESAGQLTRMNAVAGGGKVAEKHKSVSDAPASI